MATALATMYPPRVNSPTTALTADITAGDTTIAVNNLAVFPAAPNLAVIGGGENAETIRYTALTTGTSSLTAVRGFQGTAQEWPAGTEIARVLTAYDLNTIHDNIRLVNNSVPNTKFTRLSSVSISNTLGYLDINSFSVGALELVIPSLGTPISLTYLYVSLDFTVISIDTNYQTEFGLGIIGLPLTIESLNVPYCYVPCSYYGITSGISSMNVPVITARFIIAQSARSLTLIENNYMNPYQSQVVLWSNIQPGARVVINCSIPCLGYL